MIQNVTLGQFYPADSVIHRLDPRTKLAGTILYVISLFFVRGIRGMILSACFLALVIFLSGLPFTKIIRSIRPLLFVIAFSALTNLFLTPGDRLASAGPFVITRQGLSTAVFMILRISLLVTGSSIMTFTTTPGKLADGLEKGLHFLTKLHVPVQDFAMMFSIALRFIPVLSNELDRIMKAQTARGVDFNEGNLFSKGKRLIPILIPLFVAAIRRSSQIAMAMDARCYHGGEGRTKLHPLEYERRDYMAYVVILIYLVLTALCRTADLTGGGIL